jgi:hypothetical protein
VQQVGLEKIAGRILDHTNSQPKAQSKERV